MSDKQKVRPLGSLPESSIVKCRNDRFSRSRRRHDQVPVVASDGPLGFQVVENLLLIGKRADIEQIRCLSGRSLFRFQCFAKPRLLIFCIANKIGTVPVALKGRLNFINGVRLIVGGDL